jgi:hypothetical protein
MVAHIEYFLCSFHPQIACTLKIINGIKEKLQYLNKAAGSTTLSGCPINQSAALKKINPKGYSKIVHKYNPW